VTGARAGAETAGAPLAPPSPSDRRLDRIALASIAAATALHVAYAGLLSLSPQEAYYWTWSRQLDLSYFDHPPLVAWTIRLATEVFGNGERAVRLAAALHSAILSVFLWLATRRLFGARAALAAVLAAAVVPLFSIGQVIATPDGPLLSGWAMALYFTVRALDEERPAWLLAAGAATGWALLGKYTGFLLLPQILLVLALDPRGRRMLRTPWPWAGAALALALFSPVVAWNARHAGESFAFQSTGRLATFALRPVLVARFVGLQVALVTPVVLALLVEAVVTAIRRRADPAFRTCAIFSAPLLAIAAAVSPFHFVKGNWLAPAYPAAVAAAAALFVSRRAAARAVAIGGVALAAVATAYVHLVPLVPELPFPARDEGSAGWRELAGRVEQERSALPAGAFVAGCNYKVAAELAYYLPGRPETHSAELAGEPGLQFGIWSRPAELLGREGILVLDERERNACARREEACRPLVPLAPLTVRRGEDVVTTFRLWRCTYAGPPPRPARGRAAGRAPGGSAAAGRPPGTRARAGRPRSAPGRAGRDRRRSSRGGRGRSRTGPDRPDRSAGARP
jgi:4-amino-4-deoxy-L-arabinose transferase-like glycosyltransferase